tara:strand:+ start:1415 stop:1732 length:318 start_codon:yes stop_codon:yes gene_type:complete
MFLLFTHIAIADTQSVAVIKIIDKVAGKSYVREVSKDQVLNFRNILLSYSHCIKEKEGNNNFASFIYLKHVNQDKYIFKGWLLSNNISVSQVSHPVYNIKLLKCL